jgi:5-methyltetrahydropteroyltriglutamate--homocysteine methyltransferase
MTDRILTTHTGSLPRPTELIELFRSRASECALEAGLRTAVGKVVRDQITAGIAIVNDGEFGKPVTGELDYAAFTRYRFERISGYELIESDDVAVLAGSKDVEDYAEFYATGETRMSESGSQTGARCIGPITYTGDAILERDIANLRHALAEVDAPGAFMAAIAPHEPGRPGSYYRTAEEEGVALAEALGREYKLITDAGLTLQVDDARLAVSYDTGYARGRDVRDFRKWATRHLELVNHALAGIPRERVRYHLCWGSWKGPHSTDVPLSDVIDLVLDLNASQYVMEAANPRHEHEWQVWRDARVPDGTKVVVGVVTHKTNVIEHPQVVAQRLVAYAQVVGRENVLAGTDCGMGGRIHPQLAWAKIRALTDGATLASQRLWP